MIRYLFLLCIYIPFYLLAMLLAPVLPLFAALRNGPIDNANAHGVEPRLPAWLFWFDTSTDNSLWGDHGWRTKHCPKYWQTYLGMVLWLWRNPAAGFCWSVLSRKTLLDDAYTVSHSGNGLDVDKGQGKYGWYFIRCSRDGAFSLWMDTCNATAYQWMQEIAAGTRPMFNSPEEMIADLPEMVWPN